MPKSDNQIVPQNLPRQLIVRQPNQQHAKDHAQIQKQMSKGDLGSTQQLKQKATQITIQNQNQVARPKKLKVNKRVQPANNLQNMIDSQLLH